MEVGVVLDTDFGPRLEALARRMPVWVVDTPANRAAAERLWGRQDRENSELDLTTFQVAPDEPPEEWCLGILGAIDRHYSEYASDPPYNSLVVVGAQASPDIRAVLAAAGFGTVAPSPEGFCASRTVANSTDEVQS